ncbi:hypothetical protein P775_10795 [Puniceibacterium antarcticum]|uniref:N-acetyltransferase domain-containing protein n=1 Tax=Puniceibacterium antarcticum TaxID=1206336 RepID=A0A2G8RGE4_9RHOB|nr:GNAT family N-acetyltransferase [Puniceibacterium antarcticum]PIL20148.1 hypothetical protein P775_10795 [Puniceibacterium antarcticum]
MSLVLRPARSTDAGKLGAMLTAAVLENPWKPRLHSGAEDISFVGVMIDRGWVTVAEDSDEQVPLGFIARDRDEVNALFIAPPARNSGVGRALLEHAKAASDALTLWTFQANEGAQRFYRREGFIELRRTDGRDNEERLPDVLLRWQRPTMHAAPRRPASAAKAKS